MSKFIINGGKPLCGEVVVPSAKNSVLPLLAASVLIDGEVRIHNCPYLSDVFNMVKILENIGCKVHFEGRDLVIDSRSIYSDVIPASLAKELRSSIFLLGSILSRLKSADVAYPGGCEIGLRPIDIHLNGLRQLNVKVKEMGGHIYCDASDVKANDIILDLPSVGATENLIMASVFAKGRTTLRNVAREPEIVDLADFLGKAGAKIQGAGSGTIVIEGVKSLHSVDFTPIPDRIVAGTYIISAVMCGGDLTLHNIIPEHIYSLMSKLSKTTCKRYVKNGIMRVTSNGRHSHLPKIDTMYYPGFPTDLQSQILALATVCDGTSIITENIFETRFKPVREFCKMGANIQVSGRTAIVTGVPKLQGADLMAEDLRGGASLVSMALFADGESNIYDIKHIDRGYEHIENVYQSLGADIVRVD